MERGLFVHVVLCSSRFMSSDELGEVVVPLEEALRLSKAPTERRYRLKLLHANRRQTEPELFLCFGQGGDAGNGGAGNLIRMRAALPPDAVAQPVVAQHGATQQGATTLSGGPVGGQPATPLAVAVPGPELVHISTYSGMRAPAELRCPPLALLAHRSGQPVPPALAAGSPNSRQDGEGLGQERAALAALERRAQELGGVVRGPVPLSFLRSPLNPHAAWLQRAFLQ
uniref:Uncharacterized protein n=1 Tax=Alexandrium monilatum TaxID=311494 RepID=A0A7S4Q2P7_9DINO